MTKTAAIIGGGVIGGGWAARFLLMGWDVRLFDPDPEAERKRGEVLANARRALPGLSDTALPAEGSLTLCETMSEAVDGATWIQESVPERLELKQKVYQTLQEHCDESAIIGSSTSGFKPSELQSTASVQSRSLSPIRSTQCIFCRWLRLLAPAQMILNALTVRVRF